MKNFIYATKCNENKKLKFTNFMAKLSYWNLIDKHIAYENNKIVQFNKKWRNMFN